MSKTQVDANELNGATPSELVQFFKQVDSNDAAAFDNAGHVKIGPHTFDQKLGYFFWYNNDDKFRYVNEFRQFVSVYDFTATAKVAIVSENALRIVLRRSNEDGSLMWEKEADFALTSRQEKLKAQVDASAKELLTQVNSYLALLPSTEAMPQRECLLKMILESPINK
jgi:hypothetical protein